MSGWIRLHRDLIDWEWYTTPNMAHFWIHCLLSANHTVKKWRGIDILPGQFVSGRKSLSANIGLSEQQIRTCIKRLKATNQIETKNYNEFTVFTLISWKKYQSDSDENTGINQPATSQQPAINQRSTTNKNERMKECINNTEIHVGARNAPPTQEEVEKFFSDKNYPVSEAQKFYGWYESNGWRVGRNKMRSWKAATVNWMARAEQQNQIVRGFKGDTDAKTDQAVPLLLPVILKAVAVKYGASNETAIFADEAMGWVFKSRGMVAMSDDSTYRGYDLKRLIDDYSTAKSSGLGCREVKLGAANGRAINVPTIEDYAKKHKTVVDNHQND